MSEIKKVAFDAALLRCITQLESFDECSSIQFQAGEGATLSEVSLWERKNAPFKLPDDMKSFYLLFNGFSVCWFSSIGNRSVAIGELALNKLEDIKKISIDNSAVASSWSDHSAKIPNSKSLGYIVDSCNYGETVLVQRERPENGESQVMASVEVWFIDVCGRWHYLSSSFSDYLRVLVLHLGISGWQLAFTPEGLSKTTMQWMTLFCKERLCVDLHYRQMFSRDAIFTSSK